MTNPNRAPPGYFYDSATHDYVLDPAGTYSHAGATSPTIDPGGTYSAAGASNPTEDPQGTYSSGAALNRMVIVHDNDAPSTMALAFHNAIAVENYFGINSGEAHLAQEFFSQNYDIAGATLYIVREGLGQRPHLYSGNLANLNSNHLKGSLSIDFNGRRYTASLDLHHMNLADAAVALMHSLNTNRPLLATTTGASIVAEATTFTASFNRAQLDVTAVTPGEALYVGGEVTGANMLPISNSNNQIISEHLNQGGTAGGPGHYSTFGELGSSGSETMTETFGILTLGTTTGTVEAGDELVGPGIPADTAIVSPWGTSGNQWLVNNAIDITGDWKIIAPPLYVLDRAIHGDTVNHDFFDISPQGAFGFDQNPSTLTYAHGSLAADLRLDRPDGAILSSPGGQHESIDNFMNAVTHFRDQFGDPVHFGSYQTNSPKFEPLLAPWAMTSEGLGHEFLTSTIATTPAGINGPIIDPYGTHSPAGASAPILNHA